MTAVDADALLPQGQRAIGPRVSPRPDAHVLAQRLVQAQLGGEVAILDAAIRNQAIVALCQPGEHRQVILLGDQLED